MRMQVRASGDDVHIELRGVAGRQHRVLQALSSYQPETQDSATLDPTEVRVRAGSNEMRIRLRGHNGRRHDASAVYRYLRRALLEPTDAAPVCATSAGA